MTMVNGIAETVGETPGLPLPLSGRTRLYAIIGDPIAQVGSPGFFNTAFRRCGLEAVLVPVHVGAVDLERLLRGLRGVRNLDGIVVTVPHKFEVLRLVDVIETGARRVGAANAIKCLQDGTWIAENFDGFGCVSALKAAGHGLIGKRVLLVGAGGAGSAVAHAMADAGAASMRIVDPDSRRKGQLLDSLSREHPQLAAEAGDNDPNGFDVVVNASPLGMKADDPLPIDPDRITGGSLVVDVILSSEPTPLLQAAATRGCASQGGMAMLRGQIEAIEGFFRARPA